MNGQSAFLQVFGDIRITDILIFILALGYIVPQLKKATVWLKGYLKQTERQEAALGNAEKLGDYHQQSIDIRNKLQEQIGGIQTDLIAIKEAMKENEAVKMGLQAILRENIVANYNKYHDKGYMPIYARESVKKVYEAYEGLGGNDVAHDLYKKMLSWDTDPDGKEIRDDE